MGAGMGPHGARGKPARAFVIASVLCAALALGAGPLPATAAEENRASLAEERAELARRIDSLRAEIAAARGSERALAGEVDAIERDEAAIERELVLTGERIAAIEREVAGAETRLADLKEDEHFLRRSLAERRRVLADVLAALQRIGRNPPPAVAARPDDALAALRGALLLGDVLPHLSVEAEALAADLEALARLVEGTEAEWRTLERSLSALRAERERADALLAARRSDRAAAERRLAAAEARAATLERQASDLAALVEAAGLSAAGSAGAAGARPGGLVRPATGRLVRGFGEPDASGERAAGQSFATLPGGTVLAPVGGRVVYAGPFRSYGALLLIDAGDHYHVLLAGMERIDVAAGEAVSAGQPVGQMGTTRSASAVAIDLAASGPVLYVEVRRHGEPLDPERWWAGRPVE